MPLDELVADLQPEVRPVDMLLDRAASGELERAQREHTLARHRLEQAEQSEKGAMSRPEVARCRKVLEEAAERLEEARAAAERKRVTVHLRELGNRRWKELLWLVPPTRAQQQRLGRQLDHNPELFPVVAVAFSLVDVDDELTPVGPSVAQEQLDRLDEALRKAAGDPDRAVKACDAHMPDVMVQLNEKLRPGAWEQLTSVLYELNMEVSQVPLSLSGSEPTGIS